MVSTSNSRKFRKDAFAREDSSLFGIFWEGDLKLMQAMHKTASIFQQHCSLRYGGVLLAFTSDLF